MLVNLLRFVSLRQLAQKPLRTGLTVLGIALGVALFVAIQAINDSTLKFFRDNVTAMTGNAALTVFGSEAGIPEEKVAIVKAVEGVEAAVPTVETRARFEAEASAGGSRPQTLVVLGIDFLQESSVRSYKATSDVLSDPLEFLNQADSIVVTAAFAAQNRLAMDSTLDLATAHGKKTFVVRGILASDGPAAAFGGAVAIMDIDGARLAFGKEGKVDRIDVVPQENVDEAELAARIERAMGPGFEVERKESQSEAFGRMVKGYQSVLAFLSTLALLVGAFLVANTVTLSVSERRREVGILRALGASRSGVLVLFVAEAAVLGLVGGLLGVVFGRALAELLVERVSDSMSRQYVTPIEVSEIHFRLRHAVLGVSAGGLSALVAAVWPAWRAASVSGAEALGVTEGGSLAAATERRAKITRAAGLVMLAALFVGSRLQLGAPLPMVESLYPVLGGVGAAFAAPFFVTAGLKVLAGSRLLSKTPIVRLACENLLLGGARTGSNVLSLVVGLMLVIVMGTVHKSFERTIGDWQDRTFHTDLVVSSTGRVLSLEVQPLAEEVGAEIDGVAGVDVQGGQGARALRVVRIPHAGRQIAIKALDAPHPSVGFKFLDVVQGTAAEAGRALYSGENTVLVSESFALHFDKKVGETVDLDTPQGRVAFRIAATVVDFGHPDGVVIMSRAIYKRVWSDSLVTAFCVEAAPGSSQAALKAALEARFGDRGIIATLNGQLKKQLDDMIGESLAYTRAIEAAALAVGLLGLLSTLVMSLVERMRELGMLRAIGMSRFQLVRMVVAEAALLGCLGGAVAAGLGAYVARLWVVGSLASQLGWSIDVHVPWSAVLSTLLAGLAVGIVAGLISSRRVAFIPIREALVSSS